jgi:hypothetical protein
MSWWTELIGKWKRSPAPPIELPARIELYPGQPGKLAVHIYAHDLETSLGTVPCWTYVSEGFAEHRHRELVFSLRRQPQEAINIFPQDPLRFFAAAYQLAARGRPVEVGDITETSGTRFFGGHVLYVPSQPLPGITLPPSSMTALAVTTLELRAIRAFGATRVLARYGEATGTYPFAPWSERRRPDVVSAPFFEESLLSSMPIAPTAPQLCARLEGSELQLTATRGAWQQRIAKLPVEKPLAFSTGFDPEADGCLLWKPGQKARATFTADGAAAARPCGCFLAVHPDQPADIIECAEDGFVARLTADTLKSFLAALSAGERFEHAAAGEGLSLALQWRA